MLIKGHNNVSVTIRPNCCLFSPKDPLSVCFLVALAHIDNSGLFVQKKSVQAVPGFFWHGLFNFRFETDKSLKTIKGPGQNVAIILSFEKECLQYV